MVEFGAFRYGGVRHGKAVAVRQSWFVKERIVRVLYGWVRSGLAVMVLLVVVSCG